MDDPLVVRDRYETPDGLVTLYLGDALDRNEWLAADFLITDPPYGIGGGLSFNGRQGGPLFRQQQWDGDLGVRDAVLERWGYDRPYAIFGSPRRLDAAPPFRATPLVWDKGNVPAMGDTKFPWRPTWEIIYVNGQGWTGFRGESVLRHDHSTRAAKLAGHPTPKPVSLMEDLISKTPEGSVIADPFAGSGSTLIAARNLGRKAIGVEISEEYFLACVRRLESFQQRQEGSGA